MASYKAKDYWILKLELKRCLICVHWEQNKVLYNALVYLVSLFSDNYMHFKEEWVAGGWLIALRCALWGFWARRSTPQWLMCFFSCILSLLSQLDRNTFTISLPCLSSSSQSLSSSSQSVSLFLAYNWRQYHWKHDRECLWGTYACQANSPTSVASGLQLKGRV